MRHSQHHMDSPHHSQHHTGSPTVIHPPHHLLRAILLLVTPLLPILHQDILLLATLGDSFSICSVLVMRQLIASVICFLQLYNCSMSNSHAWVVKCVDRMIY
uniref:Uncharacterized protein n=1 Tax=Lotus japonicus TaxID=34305 RepID=I3S8I1_LOTJA|nr:unknown [Lotus japonicus]